MAQSYEKAGVNLEAGYEVVRRIKKHVASTSRLGVMGNIGAFGGMFDLSALKVKEPVLVSGTDGVGTKLKLAFEMDKHDTIGIDAVAMCVNDVLAQGAEPLVFLDYVAVAQRTPEDRGHRRGCRRRLPSGRLCAGGRRDRRDAGHVRRGRIRHRRIHGGRRGEVAADRRFEGQGGRRAGGRCVERRALQRLQPRAQDRRGQLPEPARVLSRTVEQTAWRGAAHADENLCEAGAGGGSQLRRARHQPHHGRRFRRKYSPHPPRGSWKSCRRCSRTTPLRR